MSHSKGLSSLSGFIAVLLPLGLYLIGWTLLLFYQITCWCLRRVIVLIIKFSRGLNLFLGDFSLWLSGLVSTIAIFACKMQLSLVRSISWLNKFFLLSFMMPFYCLIIIPRIWGIEVFTRKILGAKVSFIALITSIIETSTKILVFFI